MSLLSLTRRGLGRPAVPLLARATHSSYRPISPESVAKEDAEYEAKIQAAEQAVADMGFPRLSVFRQPVSWGDHDQFQHVNNAHYIRWFETARMRWIERVTSTMRPELRDNLALGRGVGIILASTYCRYRRPVTYPDTVVIGSAPYPLRRRDRFVIKEVAYSVNQRAMVAEADFDCVGYDYDKLCKATLPDDLVAAMEMWQYTGAGSDKKR